MISLFRQKDFGHAQPNNLVLVLLREMRTEMNARFDGVDGRFDAVEARFERMEKRLEAVSRLHSASR
jgi:hypothetical protein